MEKGFIYVLRCSDKKLYVGSTRDINNRIEAHRKGRVRTTKIIYKEAFESYTEARKREIYLKSGTGREC